MIVFFVLRDMYRVLDYKTVEIARRFIKSLLWFKTI
jgi:hypothetical protein